MGLRRRLAVEDPKQAGPDDVVVSIAQGVPANARRYVLRFCASARVEKTTILPLDQLILLV